MKKITKSDLKAAGYFFHLGVWTSPISGDLLSFEEAVRELRDSDELTEKLRTEY